MTPREELDASLFNQGVELVPTIPRIKKPIGGFHLSKHWTQKKTTTTDLAYWRSRDYDRAAVLGPVSDYLLALDFDSFDDAKKFWDSKLYENELINYPTDCFLGITARATPWARPDVISRLLLLKFRQPENYLDEKKLMRAVIDNRDNLLSELILKSQGAIKRLNETRDREYNITARLAGFFTFAIRTTENEPALNRAISKTLGLQNTLASEEEETLLTVLTLCKDAPYTV